MNTKTRKLMSRIGAGLMLGVSLFNLGAAWNKNRSGEIPKRSRQIRTKEKEDVQPGAKMVEDIAEEEALKVIAAEQQTQQNVQKTGASQTLGQSLIRYSAIGVWSVAAAVFFFSMVFNKPFALGKGFLSLLPGNPHLAVLRLQADKTAFKVGDDVKVRLTLDSAGDQVDTIVAHIEYDSQALEFNRYEAVREVIAKNDLDDLGGGMISLRLQTSPKAVVFKNQAAAFLYFKAKKDSNNNLIAINQEKSIVQGPARKTDQRNNLLGKVTSAEFRIEKGDNILTCKKLDFNPTGPDSFDIWKGQASGEMFSSSEEWQPLSSSGAVKCYYDQNRVFLLLGGISPDFILLDEYVNGKMIEQNKDQNITSWEAGNFLNMVFKIERENLGDLRLELKSSSGVIARWPEKSVGKLIYN